jgi:hypothetical protein
MNCIFNSKTRNTCWRGYNYCKHLKTANIQGEKPFMICSLETEKLAKISDNKPCSFFTKSRKTAIERIKRFRKKLSSK